MVNTLNPNAEKCIQCMHLPSDKQATIRATVHKYIQPETFCPFLQWLVYRTAQVFKSLVGASDWQKAVNLVERETLDHVREALFMKDMSSLKKIAEILNSDQSPQKIRIKKVLTPHETSFDVTPVKKAADELLSFCLSTQTRAGETWASADEERLQALNLQRMVDKILSNPTTVTYTSSLQLSTAAPS